MKKYWIVFKKSLKSEMIYRSAALAGIASALLSFLIQIFLWKALLGTGTQQNTNFSDMLLFVIINSFLLELTRANVADIIETAMVDGTISMELLRPISYKVYLLANALGKNVYGTLTRTIPVLALSMFFVAGASLPNLTYGLLFAFSAFLGSLLLFEVTYLAELMAFWLQRCWFIRFYVSGLTTIFGGTMVPLWFYPDFLKAFSYWLSFRYMTFEPINFFLGKTPVEEAWIPLLAALLWLLGLSLVDQLVWKAATRKLTVNGG